MPKRFTEPGLIFYHSHMLESGRLKTKGLSAASGT